ncbi:MAG: IS200/IS605 family transposase [Bradymonadaceae bacterium]|nr:IS200/IS605 family transposase [Lujinxingiaceae bacterium]
MPYTRLRYHIVTATHERKPFIFPDIERFIFAVMRAEARKMGCEIIAIGGIEDHLHMVSAIPPKIAVSIFIREVKTESSRAVKRQFAHMNKFAWQVGYSAFTVNPFDMKRLIHYVENQRERHARDDLWTEFERIE